MLFRKNKIDKSIAKNVSDETDPEFELISSIRSSRYSSNNIKKSIKNQVSSGKENIQTKKQFCKTLYANNKYQWIKKALVYSFLILLSWSFYMIFKPFFVDGSNNMYYRTTDTASLTLTIPGFVLTLLWFIFLCLFIGYLIFLNKKLSFFLYQKNTKKIKTKLWVIIAIIALVIMLILLLVMLYMPPPFSGYNSEVGNYYVQHIYPILTSTGTTNNTNDVAHLTKYLEMLGIKPTAADKTALINQIRNSLGAATLPSLSGLSLLYTNLTYGSVSSDFSILGIVLTVLLGVASTIGVCSWLLLEGHYSLSQTSVYQNTSTKLKNISNKISSVKQDTKTKIDKNKNKQKFKDFKNKLKSEGLDTDVNRFTTSTEGLDDIKKDLRDIKKNKDLKQSSAQKKKETKSKPKKQKPEPQRNKDKLEFSKKRLGKYLKKAKTKKKVKAEIEVPSEELEEIFKDIKI